MIYHSLYAFYVYLHDISFTRFTFIIFHLILLPIFVWDNTHIIYFEHIMSDNAYTQWSKMSDKALLQTIGGYIQSQRLNQNKTQASVASAANVSRSTLSLLERGEIVRMDSLIRVLRVLDLLHVMDAFTIQDEISPLEYAKLMKKKRKQASPVKPNNTTTNNEDLGW